MSVAKVSILMPVYNGMPLIMASIESLKAQSIKDWECVIVNDGSTDGTAQYIDSLAFEDKRFRAFHFEKNQGRPAARQRCLDEALGEYIAMLDAGDLYHPLKLEIQLNAFVHHPEVVLVGAAMCSFGTSSPLLRKRGVTEDGIVEFNGQVPNHASSILVTKRAKEYEYNRMMDLGEDRDYLERYLQGCSYLNLHDVLYYYSEFDSVTKSKIRKSYFKNIRLYSNQHKYRLMGKTILKYIYAIVIYPFMSIENILAKRGIELNPKEMEDYDKYCRRLVNKCLPHCV